VVIAAVTVVTATTGAALDMDIRLMDTATRLQPVADRTMRMATGFRRLVTSLQGINRR
jgi:hypothetical protein